MEIVSVCQMKELLVPPAVIRLYEAQLDREDVSSAVTTFGIWFTC